jgi:hypothetical protein
MRGTDVTTTATFSRKPVKPVININVCIFAPPDLDCIGVETFELDPARQEIRRDQRL